MEKTLLTRPVPDLNKSICYPLLGPKREEYTVDLYIEKIQNFEREAEKSLIDLLKRLDIRATVKTDPYSLPYKEEIKVVLKGESYMNGPYELRRVFRDIVKEVLNKGMNSFRFYFWINIITEIPENIKGLARLTHSFGRIEYCFRSYP